jgi:hypothetical protein
VADENTYSSENINSFGGINFADHIVRNASVYKTIDKTLGQRGVKAEYLYSDLIRSYPLMVLCGGECAEDITGHLRSELAYVKGFEICPERQMQYPFKRYAVPFEGPTNWRSGKTSAWSSRSLPG